MLIGGYSVCYFEAMANGVTPGLIATIMGIQPILRFAWWSAACRGGGCQDCCLRRGWCCWWRSWRPRRWRRRGSALAALLLMTFGALAKRSRQAPADVLPPQYAVSLGLLLIARSAASR